MKTGTYRYRPTVEDMIFAEGRQQLSLREAGQFDRKFHIYSDGKLVDRSVVTGWEAICRARRTAK